MFPDDAYLAKVGRLAYLVSYLEWVMLGHLSHHTGLPPELTIANLAGKTTGRIAKELGLAAHAVSEPQVSEWLTAGGRYLAAAAEIRNHLLHARPATIGGQPRLYRWNLRQDEPADVFAITDEWLDTQLTILDGMVSALSQLAWAARQDGTG